MDWNREDIAWAAGLFEGEGCISHTNGYVTLSLAMTDPDVVERFAAITGMGRPIRTSEQGRRKTMYVWTCSRFEQMQAILAMFWSFLGQRRRAKAREALTVTKYRHKRVLATRDFCVNGHAWTEKTRATYKGYRECRTCYVERQRRYNEKHRGQNANVHRHLSGSSTAAAPAD